MTKSVDISNDKDAIEAAKKAAVAQLGALAHAPIYNNLNDPKEVQLPDGRVVVMAPPGGGIMRKVASMLGNGESNVGLMIGWLKSILYVRSIGGDPVQAVNTIVDAQRVSDILGDIGEDCVMAAYQEYWPPVSIEDLQTIKK